jgi:CHRD domain
MLKTLGVVAIGGALFVAGIAVAAAGDDSYKLTSNLKARFEVPKPQGVPTGATGLFTGTATELSNDRARLRWRMTFSKLSGRATAAHIHAGRVGKAGGVLVALCGPCRNGQRGTASMTHAQLRMIRAGRTYVNIHTAKNPAGEIRGQLKSSRTSGGGTGSDSTTTGTTTTTSTDPYP